MLRSSVQGVQASLRHLHDVAIPAGIIDQLITMDERARVARKDSLDGSRRVARRGIQLAVFD